MTYKSNNVSVNINPKPFFSALSNGMNTLGSVLTGVFTVTGSIISVIPNATSAMISVFSKAVKK